MNNQIKVCRYPVHPEYEEAWVWWRSLSINEQKSYEDKYYSGRYRFYVYSSGELIYNMWKAESKC